MSIIRWRDDHTVLILEIMKQRPCLWNPKCSDYKDKSSKSDALCEIVGRLKIDGLSVEALKLKMKSIRTRYSCELGKVLQSEKLATGPHDVYEPRLFWFSLADSFLRGVCVPKCKAEEEDSSKEYKWPKYQSTTVKRKRESSITSDDIETIDALDEECDSSPSLASAPDDNNSFSWEDADVPNITSTSLTESDAFGQFVRTKHAKLSDVQKVYAETLILNILNKGIFNELSASTVISNDYNLS